MLSLVTIILTSTIKWSPLQVILYGQSIGSVPAIELAAAACSDGCLHTNQAVPSEDLVHTPFAGLVLHSALASGLRVACPNGSVQSTTWWCDPFPKCVSPHYFIFITIIYNLIYLYQYIFDTSSGALILTRLVWTSNLLHLWILDTRGSCPGPKWVDSFWRNLER